MSASVWAATTKISGNTLSASQAFTAIENQETFNITGYIYVPYSGALQVYKNGSRLILNTDWVQGTLLILSLLLLQEMFIQQLLV
jgi:hypothetical protein